MTAGFSMMRQFWKQFVFLLFFRWTWQEFCEAQLVWGSRRSGIVHWLTNFSKRISSVICSPLNGQTFGSIAVTLFGLHFNTVHFRERLGRLWRGWNEPIVFGGEGILEVVSKRTIVAGLLRIWVDVDEAELSIVFLICTSFLGLIIICFTFVQSKRKWVIIGIGVISRLWFGPIGIIGGRKRIILSRGEWIKGSSCGRRSRWFSKCRIDGSCKWICLILKRIAWTQLERIAVAIIGVLEWVFSEV